MEIKGKEGEVHMTITVTRKETGKVEQYDLVGKITEEQAQELGLIERKEK